MKLLFGIQVRDRIESTLKWPRERAGAELV
jgi:hypothetical protein